MQPRDPTTTRSDLSSPELEPLELPSCDDLWDPVELSAVLDRMVAACDRLLALAYRTPRR